ncbi:hypothetical protein VYU27_005907 [Nannochloropsis oceanica]
MARYSILLRGLILAAVLCVLAHGKASLDICEVKENEVVDKVTGISFPIHRSFPYAGKSKDFSLMGAGPRRKNLFVVEVNVYAVGLYVESAHLGKLKGFKGKDADSLSKEKGYYALLTKEKSGMNRALELVFARAVPAGKVVEALSALEGVEEKILTDFKEKLLAAIGTSAGKGETITLAWTADDKLALSVRNKHVKTFPSMALASGIFGLYMGDKAISPEAKKGFAAVAPQHLK